MGVERKIFEGRVEHLPEDLTLEPFHILVRLMLHRDDDRGHPLGLAILVLDRYLCFAVAMDAEYGCTHSTLVQAHADAMRQLERQREVCGGLVCGIAIH